MILPSTKPAILFDFLEIFGMFSERVLDVFGYDFKSSPLTIFCSLNQTNLEGIIFMVEYFLKKPFYRYFHYYMPFYCFLFSKIIS